LKDPHTQVKFTEVLAVHLLTLLPELLFTSSLKNFSQWHLALFFIWQRYYEVAKRLTKVIYKYEYGLEGQHSITYLRPGQVIMATVVIQALLLAWKLGRTVYGAYRVYIKNKSKKETAKEVCNP
jgi:hypothetical protein